MVAVERQHERPQALVPKRLGEARAQHLRLAQIGLGARRMAQRRGDLGGAAKRAVDVALHLAERDGPLGQRAVGVKDGIVRVLPSLLDEPLVGLARVLDEPVTVGVAVPFDPGQRVIDVGRQRANEGGVTGPAEVGRGQHHEERCGIDAAVVAPERHLAERGHLAPPRLVQDLPRLRVALGRGLGRLRGGQEAEHAAGDLGRDPEDLHRGEDPVASKRRAEPGHAGVGIGAVGRLGDHHLQIGDRAVQPLVEIVAGGVDAAAREGGVAELGRQRGQGVLVRHRGRGLRAQLARDGDQQGDRLPRPQREMVAGLPAREILGRRIEGHPGPPRHPVEPLVAEHQARLAGDLVQLPSAPLSLGAAHLEDVEEVGVEVQPQIDLEGVAAEAGDPQPHVADPVPEEGAAKEVQLAPGQRERTARLLEIGVRQIDGQEIVLLLHRRAEQQRAAPAHPQLQPRKKPRVVEVDPLLAEPHRLHVAVAIEHREHPAVLEDPRPVVGARGGGLDVELVVVAQHLVVGMLWMTDFRHVTPQAISTPASLSTPVSLASAGTRPSLRCGCPPVAPFASRRS